MSKQCCNHFIELRLTFQTRKVKIHLFCCRSLECSIREKWLLCSVKSENNCDLEKTNGCSSAAAVAAMSREMLMAAFLSVLTQAEPSRAVLSCAVLPSTQTARAWTEGGALCGLKPLVSL